MAGGILEHEFRQHWHGVGLQEHCPRLPCYISTCIMTLRCRPLKEYKFTLLGSRLSLIDSIYIVLLTGIKLDLVREERVFG